MIRFNQNFSSAYSRSFARRVRIWRELTRVRIARERVPSSLRPVDSLLCVVFNLLAKPERHMLIMPILFISFFNLHNFKAEDAFVMFPSSRSDSQCVCVSRRSRSRFQRSEIARTQRAHLFCSCAYFIVRPDKLIENKMSNEPVSNAALVRRRGGSAAATLAVDSRGLDRLLCNYR